MLDENSLQRYSPIRKNLCPSIQISKFRLNIFKKINLYIFFRLNKFI
ncbi:hypothetical protein LEP1GSC199_0424 [Leptospira vanthielii serovar Holland str. Waz Holland = ATCC 700522]|uniref:Uncharacterized protein n=1 Tax=Leptospira vanthielii serovar Holland str. Waz Holland = ATCC 700522 TaxID=1218591 RepID=N1W3P0_9LEPT|nr:hypothetical protein LEP1GSC199_0424 [Leptospira vanthielii serovar Holland str. Waz Holland = ATCC 700522]